MLIIGEYEDLLYECIKDVDLSKREKVEKLLREKVSAHEKLVHLTHSEKEHLCKKFISKIIGFDCLDPLIDDPKITEIMINGHKDIFIESQGVLRKVNDHFEKEEDLLALCKRIAYMSGKSINRLNPIVNGYIGSNARVNMVISPVANKSIITIRKFSSKRMTLEELSECGAFPSVFTKWFETMVKERKNCFICGGTGSGKTTLLNALLQHVPDNQRTVIIEDVPEIKCNDDAHAVYMLTREANQNGLGQVSMDVLIQNALRMRPDRMVVGEVRGKEVVDMIHAMNTGHEGSISTGHANSIMDMYHRLHLLMTTYSDLPATTIDFLLASSIHYFIYVRRLNSGKRVVENIKQLSLKNSKPHFEDVIVYNHLDGSYDSKI